MVLRNAALAALIALAGCRTEGREPVQAIPAPVVQPVALGFHISPAPVVLTEIDVYDGDTFDAGLERFRPDGIDTPELGDKAHCALEQTRGEQARDFARNLLTSAQRVTATPTERRRDRYGRVVARIDVDGRDFNEVMIESGLAMPYRRPPGWNWCATPVVACEVNSEVCGRVSVRRPR